MPLKSSIIKKRQNYKVKNWSAYNESLKNRGSLTLWISEDIHSVWYENNKVNDGTGKPKDYSDQSILLCHQLRLQFKQPLRQTEGLVNSLLKLSGLNISCPDYSTLSRRCGTLKLKMPNYKKQTKEVVIDDEKILILDSTGLKQYGKDEWHQEKHKINPRRTWRKLHIAIDNNHNIIAVELTNRSIDDASVVPVLTNQISQVYDRYIGDGAYDSKDVYDKFTEHNSDAKIVIPPRDNAVISNYAHPERNKSIDIITKYGRGAWQKIRKYGKQNYVELAMLRYKRIIGNKLYPRDINRQRNEVIIAASILNKFTSMGMPNSYRVS